MPTLDFKGKQFIYGHHLTVPIRTLQVDAGKSRTGENEPSLGNDNLIIHSDNLHALKALLPMKYAGFNLIKCIYIDPKNTLQHRQRRLGLFPTTRVKIVP